MIIGIGGVSNSGKSGLAKKIKDHLKSKKVTILCQDDFIYPVPHLPTIQGHIDWETPDTINFIEFKNSIYKESGEADIVIAEGLFAFYDNRINALYDRKIFIEIGHNTFIQRKKLDLRWGEEPDWYIDHIWNSYLKYGVPIPLTPDYTVINGEKPADILSLIFNFF